MRYDNKTVYLFIWHMECLVTEWPGNLQHLQQVHNIHRLTYGNFAINTHHIYNHKKRAKSALTCDTGILLSGCEIQAVQSTVNKYNKNII